MNLKEINYDTLTKECEPKYILQYQESGNIIKHERKFNNPKLLQEFIKNLNSTYTWTIYKKE